MVVMAMKTWNRERKRTRDRLLDYDPLSIPSSIDINPLIPTPVSINEQTLQNIIFNIATKYGFSGTNEDFWERFNTQTIHRGTIDTFPVPGKDYDLYLDTNTGILYYFKIISGQINSDIIAKVNIAIVGTSIVGSTTTTYLYIPVQAFPIENLIYDCGNAFS